MRPLNTIAVVGTHHPRRCGIATFTTELSAALDAELAGRGRVIVLAVSDTLQAYSYPVRVGFEIRENIQNDYRVAADFLNINEIDVVVVQHEFGIFGGPGGAHIISLLRSLRMPVVTTLHTVSPNPFARQRAVMTQLLPLSNRVVIPSRRGKAAGLETYGIDKEKAVCIPHGVPDADPPDSDFCKARLGLTGRKVILSFGLLSRDKGLEDMVQAMQTVVAHEPRSLYVILGQTHPRVAHERIEEYRQELLLLVHELGLQEHVAFQNRFVSTQELLQYLGAADVFAAPYIDSTRMVSGTLAYAMGAGRAIVATPYPYAEEMLAKGRGRIVPFHDPPALAQQVIELLDRDDLRAEMGEEAYGYSRSMTWRKVARRYVALAREVLAEQVKAPRVLLGPSYKTEPTEEPPEPDLRHLRTMTDDTGLLQHAVFATPDRRHGYCTDDNARALVIALQHWALRKDDSVLRLAQTYLSFLIYAFREDTGRFRNFMDYERRWLEEPGSEDCHGRAIWALGTAAASAPYDSISGIATRLLNDALPAALDLQYPRAWAFTLIGLHAYLSKFAGDAGVRRAQAELANRLVGQFQSHPDDQWPWFEDEVTYCNGRVCQALLLAGQCRSDSAMVEEGRRSLRWLLEVQTGERGQLSLIGNDGWLVRGRERPRFDQQPVEIPGLIDACAEAYRITGDAQWVDEARRCLAWFLGDNDLEKPVCDFNTGGCQDGLSSQGVNRNQGAESTVAWLLSALTMHQLAVEHSLGTAAASRRDSKLSV